MSKIIAAFALFGLAACATFPTLDQTITDADRAAPFPELINIAPILAHADRAGGNTAQAEAATQARIAALNARADRLRRLDI